MAHAILRGPLRRSRTGPASRARKGEATSAALALRVQHPFDRYVLCEIDAEKANALEARVRRDFPNSDTTVIEGDCNDNVDRILGAIPRGSRDASSLSFCVADPFSLSALRFSTIEKLSSRFVDFLILIASGMDARRNQEAYLSPSSTTLSAFLGDPDWRGKWANAGAGPGDFGLFVVDQLGRRMASLSYIYPGPHDAVAVTVRDRGRLLYHLAFFSRHDTGRRFWEQAKR